MKKVKFDLCDRPWQEDASEVTRGLGGGPGVWDGSSLGTILSRDNRPVGILVHAAGHVL